MAAGSVAGGSGFELESDGEEELRAEFAFCSRVVDVATGRAGIAAMSPNFLGFSSDDDGGGIRVRRHQGRGGVKAAVQPACDRPSRHERRLGDQPSWRAISGDRS